MGVEQLSISLSVLLFYGIWRLLVLFINQKAFTYH